MDKLSIIEEADDLERLRRALRQAFERRRASLVYGIAKLFQRELEDGEPLGRSPLPSEVEGWQAIESLSQLRSLVGGRFQNLKQRWVAAGLPLREHRGDREGEAAIDENGWIELAVWINKQGFEAKLPTAGMPALIEVRRYGFEAGDKDKVE